MDRQAEPNEPRDLDPELFNEAVYLARYPDVAEAVVAGRVASGWVHYKAHGRAEGRRSGAFDDVFYLRSYPLAVREITAGLAETALDHYRRIGRARGYLPGDLAPRPDDAAPLPRFGGFWPDRPDALDIVDGKLEIGQIDEAEAARLRFWIAHGYVVLPKAIPQRLLQRALRDLDRAYAGGFADLLFECHSVAPGYAPWHAGLNSHAAKALDLHHFSQAIRDLIFARPIAAFLGLLCESKVFASQSLGFLRGSAQEGHQDSAYVAYSVPRRFAASWIALEDVTVGAGELFYY